MTTIASLKPNQSFLRRSGTQDVFVFRGAERTHFKNTTGATLLTVTLMNVDTQEVEEFMETETVNGFDVLTEMSYKENDGFSANNTERAIDVIGRPILKESVMDLAILAHQDALWSAEGELTLVGINVYLAASGLEKVIHYSFKDAKGKEFRVGGRESELAETNLYPYRQKATRYTPWALAGKSGPRISA